MSTTGGEAGDAIVDIVVKYEEGDHVEPIVQGLTRRVPPPRIRDAAAAGDLIIAGSISIWVLVQALIAWRNHLKEQAKDQMLVLTQRSDDRFDLDKRLDTSRVGHILVVPRDGEVTWLDTDKGPEVVADSIRALRQ